MCVAEQIDTWQSASSSFQLDLLDGADLLLADILDMYGDQQNTAASLTILGTYPEPLIHMVLSETRQAHLEGRITKTRGAFFTDALKRLARLRTTKAVSPWPSSHNRGYISWKQESGKDIVHPPQFTWFVCLESSAWRRA